VKASRPQQLHNAIVNGIAELAQLARTNIVAADVFANLPLALINKMIDELQQPNAKTEFLAAALTWNLAKGIEAFQQEVKSHPERFRKVARERKDWPVLRSTREKGDDFEAIARSIDLGAFYGRKGNYKAESVALSETSKRIFEIERLRAWADRCDPNIFAPDIKKLVNTQFPPRTREPKSLRVWWDAVKPMLERDRAELLQSGALSDYFDMATKATSNPKTTRRSKPDAGAWNYFLTDCKSALKNLADKTRNNP